MIAVLMGVSGSGKTTIGRLLAERLGWRFIEGDEYHPAENVAKMAAGIPLEDADRWPWLDALNQRIRGERNAIVTCSALKESYRRRLLAGIADARIVYLHAPKALIAKRVAQRKHKFMPASLLESQFATLEPPAGAIDIDVSGEPEDSVDAIVQALQRR
ncbi:MAG TPA: gluconokinase [Burkholderiales bacterium]|jgi:carbohydrate kinase (thermoresistant glucokinase family)